MKIDYELPVTIHAKGDFGDGYKELALVDVTVGGTIFYTPHTLTLGAEWKGLSDRLHVSAELRYAFWSKAPDPTVGLKVGLTSEMDLVTQVLGDNFNVRAGGEDIRLSDTLSVRAGAEYWLVPEVLNIRGGYAYTPTPVPVQNGRTNLLDGDSHMIALGSTVYFHDPLDIFNDRIDSFQKCPRPRRINKTPGARTAHSANANPTQTAHFHIVREMRHRPSPPIHRRGRKSPVPSEDEYLFQISQQ